MYIRMQLQIHVHLRFTQCDVAVRPEHGGEGELLETRQLRSKGGGPRTIDI